MNRISLSKDGGLTPHLCICERCMKNETQNLTIGVIHKAEDQHGNVYYSDRDQRGKTLREARDKGIFLSNWSMLDEHEKIPMGLCTECEEELALHAHIVKRGGVYFRCSECMQSGVIQPNEFTIVVKKHHGIKENEPVGVQFTKCSEHSTS